MLYVDVQTRSLFDSLVDLNLNRVDNRLMKQSTKDNIIIALAIAIVVILIVAIGYALYSDITNPQPKPQHGSYAHCEYRTVKNACGKWVTKTY